MPITEFLSYLERERRYSQHTLLAYRNDLNSLKEFLEDKYDEVEFKKVTSEMLRSWVIDLMEKQHSSRTVNRKISTLKSFYQYLKKKGQIKVLPTSKITSPKVEKPLPSFLKVKETDNLFEQIEFGNDFSGFRDKIMLEIFYATGIRLSELIQLKNESFDRGTNTLKVLGKRNKERIIPISNSLAKSLVEYLSEKQSLYSEPFIFLTDSGKKLYPKFVYRKVNSYLSMVSSLQKKSPHILRHTFATHMLNNGADLNTIKEFLGHANLSATEVYTHNSIEKLKNIYKQAHPRA
tara:strand:- start:382 stop:1257 length:876 start_codon:yes stop_codon:yes gene_type:complete